MVDDAWIPCIFEVSSPQGRVHMAGPLISNTDDTDYQMMFRLPIPAMKGNMRLHIDGCRVGVLGADQANYVSQLSINGMTYQAMKVMFETKEPINAQNLKSYSMTPYDASTYEAVLVRIWCSVSEANKLHLSSVLLHCYYA
ncbi:MAG: hypothetical protein ACFFDQ_11145 [Candidatus Thorarchaeota archaeon]